MNIGKKNRSIFFVLAGSLLVAGSANAVNVKLTADRDSIQVSHHGRLIEVQRNQDTEHLVDPMWAKTSRNCPPFCIEPHAPVPGVALVTEPELFTFMEQKVNKDLGVIIDARLPDWHERGTIPGSVNIPFTVFQRDYNDTKLVKALTLLGAKPRGTVSSFTRWTETIFGNNDKTDHWDFSEAKELVLWCNGPWCGQSPHAIRALAKLGYPLEKIHYYRGGMQMWQILGLTTVIPERKEMLFADAGGSE